MAFLVILTHKRRQASGVPGSGGGSIFSSTGDSSWTGDSLYDILNHKPLRLIFPAAERRGGGVTRLAHAGDAGDEGASYFDPHSTAQLQTQRRKLERCH